MGNNTNKKYNAGNLTVKMKLAGFKINISGENIIENYVFNKVGAVVLLIVIILDVGKGDR